MIRLEHVTKLYNKHKVNQFTVCKDINLEFEDHGLVVILGSSGSGKTTLLNVISGMDRFDSGKLIFDDVVFEKYSHHKWDEIRKHKIGYVYQNYHLLKEATVKENIEPILKMQGLRDPDLITQKVQSLISSVGLGNYADRLVKQLSGGQQQRIAFARALANNPEVILADEPTGNLDGKTTIELMNLIKEISKSRLIIMVTHEQALCDYYADRIIEIENGTIIKDYPNDGQRRLDFIQEHIINLGDFEKTSIHGENLEISRYTNQEKPQNLQIDLIERNQTLYVKIQSNSLKRTKYLDSDSEILIQDGLSTATQDNHFQLPDLNIENTSKKQRSVFTWRDTFHYAWKKLKIFHGGSKMLFLVLILVGLIVSISVGLVGEIFHVDQPFTNIHPSYVSVQMERSLYSDFESLSMVDGVDELMLVSEPFAFSILTPTYYEIHSSTKVSAQPIDIQFFDLETLILGSIPQGYGIIIDESVADDIIQSNYDRGIQSYEDVLSCSFKLQTSGIDTDMGVDSYLSFSISGIAKSNTKSVWMAEELIYSLVTPYLIDYRLVEDHMEIISGEMPSSANYVLLNANYPSVLSGDTPYNIGVSTGTFYISGIYDYTVDGVSYDFSGAMVSTLDFIKMKYYVYAFSRRSDFDLLVYANNVDSTLSSLYDAGYSARSNAFEESLAKQIKLEENQNFYLLGIVGIAMSAFSILLIMRSSLISRMYEVSVYRGIGISRKEIRRIFTIEILLTTTFSSIIGFSLMAFLLIQAQSTLTLVRVAHFSVWSILLGILGLYLINTMFGLIPIQLLLRKTPSNIMKTSDL